MSDSPKVVEPSAEEVTSEVGGGGDGVEKANGDSAQVSTGEVPESSAMEVDIDPEVPAVVAKTKGDGSIEKPAEETDKDTKDISEVVIATDNVTLEEKGKNEPEFIVLEEDDEGEDGDADVEEKRVEDTPSGSTKEKAESVEMDTEKNSDEKTDTEKSKAKAGPGKAKEGTELILVNPLFGKDSVPVIDVDDDSSSESGHDEDFADAVQVNGAHKSGVGTDCGCGCYQEKGILIAEIERLRKAIGELGSRHSVLEDFIQVEYAEKFKTFLKNRDHLMSMGFGVSDSDPMDGKKSEKSSELVELLSMINEQSSSGAKEDKSTSKSKSASGNLGGSATQKPSGSSSLQSSKSGKIGGIGGASRQTSKPKPIQSINVSRDREDRGGGRDWDHPSIPSSRSGRHPVIRPEVEMIAQMQGTVPPPPSLNQYQQQLMAQQQHLHAATQARYYEAMLGNAVGQGRDYGATAVERTNLYSQPQVPGSNSIGFGGGAAQQERKRKRNSQGSTGSGNVPNPIAQQQRHRDLNKKKKCPICPTVLNGSNTLKDHVLYVHCPVRMRCPSCIEEFSVKRKLISHLAEVHQFPKDQCGDYADKCYASISEQVSTWLSKTMSEAKPPTIAQWNAHQQRVGMINKAKYDPSSGGGGPSSAAGVRIFSGSRGHPAATASAASTEDMYGPGGYAQYAARYLQQRSATSNRLYTPF